MNKVTNATGRFTALAMALSLLSAGVMTVAAPIMASADALNPLTDRTLLLTSSSPGWDYLDGSGNALYAPPGSGSNGQKTGETFTVDTSTNSTNAGLNATNTPVKAFTLQYCTTPAGTCSAPGTDSAASTPGTDDATHTDLNVVTNSPVDGTDFEVILGGTPSSGWTMTSSNLENGPSGNTGKNNYITLTNAAGISPTAGEQIQLVFKASATNYITNPGAGSFFVKLNDYTSDTYQNFEDNYPNSGNAQDTIDGGVTVANVMNQSIEIQTKVEETMDFSVGTVDPDTVAAASLAGGVHGVCDPILEGAPGASTAPNTITLGNANAEDSLSTSTAYDANSYWRLSSNSSNGATVYYSGPTLHNTEGNEVAPMTDNPSSDASAYAHTGTEQFGLGLETDGDTLDSNWGTDVSTNSGYLDSNGEAYWHNPTLSPLVATASYGDATGALGTSGGDAKFAFNANANTIPVPIASEASQVVDCATGKMRYVADIAATTPAGIYTTKINYLASPEY
jgi:hypothetical protein